MEGGSFVDEFIQEQEAQGICFRKDSNTAVVKGFIGGEAHDSYVLHLRAGRQVTVEITSTGNRAGLTVSTTEFGEQVSFGEETESRQSRRWTGTIPQTDCYFLSVVAHPQARYTLKVTLE